MWSCPVCQQENSAATCPVCGYDPSRDYGAHPTLARIPEGSVSVSGRRAAYLARQYRFCPCCGRPAEDAYCGFCGLHMDRLRRTPDPDQAARMAADHREAFLAGLKDISVILYRYRWNPAASRLELRNAEGLRLADGQDCHPGVFWSEPLFGQLDPDDYPQLELKLSYFWRGRKKTAALTVPTLRTGSFWQLGLLVDDRLRLRVFLGDPTAFTVSEPLELELSE